MAFRDSLVGQQLRVAFRRRVWLAGVRDNLGLGLWGQTPALDVLACDLHTFRYARKDVARWATSFTLCADAVGLEFLVVRVNLWLIELQRVARQDLVHLNRRNAQRHQLLVELPNACLKALARLFVRQPVRVDAVAHKRNDVAPSLRAKLTTVRELIAENLRDVLQRRLEIVVALDVALHDCAGRILHLGSERHEVLVASAPNGHTQRRCEVAHALIVRLDDFQRLERLQLVAGVRVDVAQDLELRVGQVGLGLATRIRKLRGVNRGASLRASCAYVFALLFTLRSRVRNRLVIIKSRRWGTHYYCPP